MTLNKSLFNSGIFKNTVYRFKWGSFLYFIALFFSVPFMLIVSDFDRLAERIAGSSYYIPTSIILRSDYLTLPMILAVAVPTVVAVLVFNNVHSGKQGIFTHGLPVDRRTNYISNLAASFVLMAVPVLLTAIILMIMSFGKYGQLMTSMSVIYWAGLNLNMLFVMFSVAAFSAFLTGNIAAHIGINVFIHLVPMIIGWAIYIISEQLLYGFNEAHNFVATKLIDNNPIVWIFGRSLSLSDAEEVMPLFTRLQTWIYIIGAVAVYAVTYLLYKKRKIEACGDVAAFKVFKPILKYAVTTGAAIALFGILISMDMGILAMIVVVLAITAIVYFAAEMLLNKSFKVFKGAYKGYLGFVLCCAIFISFFAYTSVFGYETRIPKLSEIESAGMHEAGGYGDTMIFDEPQMIKDTIEIHKEIISDIPTTRADYGRDYDGRNRCLYITYKLNSGEIMRRSYIVPNEMFDKAMTKMYQSKAYKLRITLIDNVNIENVDNLVLGTTCSDFRFHISLNEDADDFMQAIKRDVEMLSYDEMEKYDSSISVSVEFSCDGEENKRLKYFKDSYLDTNNPDVKYAYHNFRLIINSNYKNAYAFLKENGYYEQIVNQLGQSLVICKKPISKSGEIINYKGDTGRFSEFLISAADCVNISPVNEKILAEKLATSERGEITDGKYYLIFAVSDNFGNDFHAMNYAGMINAEEMPDYLKAYVED